MDLLEGILSCIVNPSLLTARFGLNYKRINKLACNIWHANDERQCVIWISVIAWFALCVKEEYYFYKFCGSVATHGHPTSISYGRLRWGKSEDGGKLRRRCEHGAFSGSKNPFLSAWGDGDDEHSRNGAATSPPDSEGTKSPASHPKNFALTQVQIVKWHNHASPGTEKVKYKLAKWHNLTSSVKWENKM